eukprot:ANDGO_01687.mRNA.1 hypothetical protein
MSSDDSSAQRRQPAEDAVTNAQLTLSHLSFHLSYAIRHLCFPTSNPVPPPSIADVAAKLVADSSDLEAIHRKIRDDPVAVWSALIGQTVASVREAIDALPPTTRFDEVDREIVAKSAELEGKLQLVRDMQARLKSELEEVGQTIHLLGQNPSYTHLERKD